jgi:hypothetical protein
MKNKVYNWIFKLAVIFIVNKLKRRDSVLTPEYLKRKHWVYDEGYYIEPYVKDRDRVSISFENGYYRVWHSNNRTFIALETTIEWFEIYYLIIHPDNRNNLK